MKIVFVSGPYRAATGYGVHLNIQVAESAAIAIWQMGAVAFCPHKNSAYLGGIVEDRAFLDGDLEILRRCDAVFLLTGWNFSAGAIEEVKLAHELGIPCFEVIEHLREWIKGKDRA
jgi:hypothetical protein